MSFRVLKKRFICNTMFYMKHLAGSRKTTAKAQPIIKKSNGKSGVSTFSRLEKKVKSSEKKMKPNVLVQKIEPKTKKASLKKIVQAVEPKLKKAKVAAPIKPTKLKTVGATKLKIQKLKAVSSSDKIKVVGKKTKLSKVAQTNKPKTKVKPIPVVATPKSKARKLKTIVSVKQSKPVEKKKILSVPTRKVKKQSSAKIKLNDSKKPVKSKNLKSATKIAPVNKAKTVVEKNKQNAVAQKTRAQTKNNKSAKAGQVAKPKKQKVNPVISAVKAAGKKANVKSAKSGKIVPVKKNKSEAKQTKPAVFPRTIKLERAKVIKAKTKKTKPIVPVAEMKVIKLESVNLPVENKLKRRKIKQIGSAVFRGKKERYDFKVFPLDGIFEDVSAIYVISRRKIDRQKKGHHALVCIGQTDSVLGEIKRHKIKCIKKHNANAISILPEADVRKRLKIEEDLRAAHATACNII